MSKCRVLLLTALVVLCTQLQGVSAVASESQSAVPIARIGDNVVKVEIASTPAEIQYGLMKRTSLPDDHGMVFLFHPAQHVQFWMYNCLMSLDMLFIKDGKIIKMCENVPPCDSKNPQDCPKYPDKMIQVTEVIEVQPGYAKKHHLKEGEKVSFELPDLGQPQAGASAPDVHFKSDSSSKSDPGNKSDSPAKESPSRAGSQAASH